MSSIRPALLTPRRPAEVEVKKAVFHRADGGDFGSPLARDWVRLTLEVPKGAKATAKVRVQAGSRDAVPVRSVVVTVSLERGPRSQGLETVKVDVPLQVGRGRHRLVLQSDGQPPAVLHQHLFNAGLSR